MHRGAWWAIVCRVAKSWTWLKWLSMHSCGQKVHSDFSITSYRETQNELFGQPYTRPGVSESCETHSWFTPSSICHTPQWDLGKLSVTFQALQPSSFSTNSVTLRGLNWFSNTEVQWMTPLPSCLTSLKLSCLDWHFQLAWIWCILLDIISVWDYVNVKKINLNEISVFTTLGIQQIREEHDN